MNKKKIVVSIFVTLLLLVMVGINGWWFYIKLYGPDKVISITHEIGLQSITNKDGEEEYKYFIELNYFSNKNGDGVELFEIKYNYILDQNKTAFYSQGFQYVVNSGNNIDFVYKEDLLCATQSISELETAGWFFGEGHKAHFGSFIPTESTSVYNYASGDDYETTTLSTNPINLDTTFKIELGEDLFEMKFKNRNTQLDNGNLVYKGNRYYNYRFAYGWYETPYYYTYYDHNYFSKLLYENVVKALPAGLNHAVVFEFGDLFDYYKLENGQYVNTSTVETEKIKNDMKSYYAIKVFVFDGGAKSASDSIFNMLNGSPYYNSSSTIIEDYVLGRTYKRITEKDFDIVVIEQGYCLLKLKEDFVKFYSKFDTIVYNVIIDLDTFQEIEIFGFTKDNGLSRFNINKCILIQTIDGNRDQREVSYV